MLKPLIAANWKMNKSVRETEEFITSFIPMVKDVADVDILIAPPFTSLHSAAQLLSKTDIMLAGQDVFYEEKGAFTGEISPSMLLDAGCSAVIIGHSERRQYFSETNEIVNKKIKTARKNSLDIILCIGESLEEREKKKTFEVLETQLAGSLKDMSLDCITIAYEPIWAIGTGKTASPEQANEAHTYVKEWLKRYNSRSEGVRILYGGSVTPENTKVLMAQPAVNGALVGGASLKPESFAKIVSEARS
jgi:triosephosphate isomerase